MADTITIPRDEYRRLLEAAETLADIRVYDRAVAALEVGRESRRSNSFAPASGAARR